MTDDYTIAPNDDHCCGCCANMEYEDAYGFGGAKNRRRKCIAVTTAENSRRRNKL